MCHPCPLSRKLQPGRMQTVEGLQLSASFRVLPQQQRTASCKVHPSWGDHILSWARLGLKAQNSPPDCLRLCLACITFVFSLLLNLIPSPFFSQVLISNKPTLHPKLHLHLMSPAWHWQAGFPRIRHIVATQRLDYSHTGWSWGPLYWWQVELQQTLAQGSGPIVYW